MKRIYFLIVIFLVLSSGAFSQSVWWTQTSGVSSSLRAIYFIDNNTGFAVGDHYTILKTPNAGNNWLIQQINEAEPRGFFSVYFVNNSTGWAVGDGKILKTTNCGINWIGQSSGTGYWFKSVYFIDNNVGWIVGGDGVIINTTNGGTNWTAQSSGTSTWLISVHFEDPDLGWAVGEHGIILCTTNGGINWTGQTSGTEDLISVFFIDANTGWTVGHDYFQTSGKILKTTNGGTNWINQPGITNKDLNSVYFINDNTGWIVGYHNIFKSTNGGTNWISQTNSPNNNLRSIYVTGLDTAWVVGDSGKILSSTNDSIGSLHHDVGVTSIIVPVQDSTYYGGCFSLNAIYPKVEVKRFDTNNPINLFDVHCEITKGINIVYSKTVQDYLSAGETHTISFDYFAWLSDDLDHSEFNLKSWTSLASDSNLTNDTARSIFKIKNPGYGYSEACNYYFINNTTDAFFCTWQNVEFNWEDTTGSVNLISNGLANFPFTAGTISNGCFRLPDVFPGGNKFKFFGTCYDTIVISTNGIIGLGGSLDEMITSNPVQIPSVLAAPKPAIFPFWYACNFQDPDIAGRNLKYKLSGNKLIITFDRVPAYNTVYDSSDYLSYQVILETGDDCSSENGKIKVQFDNDKSGSTFLNNYINGNLSTGLVGIQNADGTLGIQYRYSNSNTPGYLFFHNQWGTSPIAVEFGQINELLPVELESFTSSVIENNVNLIWRVNSEINNAGFDIERSGVKGQTSNEWIKTGFVNGKGTATYSQLYSFEDKNLSSGKYKYRLKQIDFNGSFEYYDLQNEVVVGVPVRFNLSQNYPNPFNPATKIKFEIPVDSKVIMKIYDNIGREMKTLVNEFKSAGYYTVDFNGSNFSSGVYFYKITAGDFSEVKKMTLLK